MSTAELILIESIATIEECGRARALSAARSSGIGHPVFVAFRRDRAVDRDASGRPVFVAFRRDRAVDRDASGRPVYAWRALVREAAVDDAVAIAG